MPAETRSLNFVEALIEDDLAAGRVPEGRVRTRFPPEPNGYLHIGHAKAICTDFGLAAKYGGLCNLRFDDTNPTKEEQEYVDAIQADIRWLGFDWEDRLFYASGFFEELHRFAVELIEKGKAYVDDLSLEEMRAGRGTATEPGTNSPYRDRSVAENLDLFARMRAGEFADGSRTLRAKIDMAHPNHQMRDPVMVRILRATHHRTGDDWCIYPTYDWAHGQCDALEGITHSLCTLEFENHRPLYDWYLANLDLEHRPKQIEFARLALTYVVVSKRKLREIIDGGQIAGWDDPRMPTLRGLRRRGYPPEAIRAFADGVGLTKAHSTIDIAVLENAVREELNRRAPRRMAVLRPLKVVIEDYPEGMAEEIEAVNNPGDESAGTRKVPFAREIYIERDDFREDPPRKYFRLAPGIEVRLRYSYCITCTDVIKDPTTGEVVEVRCTHDPATLGRAPEGRKVKGVIHWVPAAQAVEAEVRLYDHLFRVPDPLDVGEDGDFKDNLNPNSLEVLTGCKLEPDLASARPGERFQFERLGYFCVDTVDSKPGAPVFNRTVSLRDTWAKIEKRAKS
ncbi:MAG: glutamine--tRNA ligase/YqeY domain fusion protein [Planctomycetota bacterium]|nr:glutamine--tRNA ligase/YqeY domain fusion protein [Planctomycetota bacterium]